MTDGWRMDYHLISSPWAFSPGELKKKKKKKKKKNLQFYKVSSLDYLVLLLLNIIFLN